ncbi:hypothetical protein GCM10009123_15830 [Kangiella japonica]|uniref:Uncharacterized protein n=1 Tax=Kangiella japonica TaxID=647384 RepID=A0ABN0T1I5_9GAMM
MKNLLRHSIIVAALLSMALLSVAHANSPTHQDAKELQECSYCLHHAGTFLHTAPYTVTVPQPLEGSSERIVYNQSTIFVRAIRPFFVRGPPQLA